MSSITLKISSLLIRTLSKPIANQLKVQAREHGRFRRVCISFAQSLHRIDMRLRLGLLRDPAAIDKQIAKDAAADAAAAATSCSKASSSSSSHTVSHSSNTTSTSSSSTRDAKPSKPRIRPLSEAKAIDMGANFISEAFLFFVGGAVIVNESLRSRRKENNRREDVTERLKELEENERLSRLVLVKLEDEVLSLRAEKRRGLAGKEGPSVGRILSRRFGDMREEDEEEEGGNESTPGQRWWWPFGGTVTARKGQDVAQHQGG